MKYATIVDYIFNYRNVDFYFKNNKTKLNSRYVF